MAHPQEEARPATQAPARGAGDAPLQLLALLAVAAVLRAYRLDSPLWYDEIVTLVEYVRLAPGELLTTYTSSNNHLLYSLLAHASVESFGESAAALRLPAALFGIASLAAFWWMAHEFAPAREARLASWLVALSYHHVWFSQNARGYTGILLFAWLGTALFLRARRGGPRRLWIAYALTLTLGAWTHLSALFVFAAHGIVYLGQEASRLRDPRNSRGLDTAPLVALSLGLLFVLLLYSPLLAELSATLATQSAAASGSATVTTWKDPLWTLLEVARGLPLGPASLAVGSAAFAIGAVGLTSIARTRPFDALLLVLPTAVTLVVLLAVHFNLWPRYFLVGLGFAALLGVRGLFAMTAFAARTRPGSSWLDPPERLASALCIAAIAASAATVAHNYRYPKQDYPGAHALVAERRRHGEPVLTAGLASYAYGRYYEPDWLALESVEQLDGLQSERTGLWLVYSFPMHLKASRPALYARIERDFELMKRFPGTLGDGDVRVLRLAERTAPEEPR